MKVSPLSIKKQEFNKAMRGYDKDEVQAFLDKLSDEFEAMQKENDSLKKELEESTGKLAEFRRIEKNLQDTLLKAQESSSKSIESTKKQSTLMIKEAEIKASQIMEKAKENANEIRNAVINLREEKNLIIANLKAIINSQSHLLDLKIENAGEETIDSGQIEQAKKIDINIEEIVNKLL